jgi:mannosyltransferase OCH1-like enzyme
MIMKKMRDSSPVWSMGATSPLRAKLASSMPPLPAQVRRFALPYAAFILLVLFALNADLFHRSAPPPPKVEEEKVKGFSFDDPVIDAPRLRPDWPKKIWQTWKVHPLAFDEREVETGRTWLGKNPDWRYEVLTDYNDVEYVRFHYGPQALNRPDIVAFYESVSAAIVKADLLRYLIIYAEGGVYTDVDVDAIKSIRKWIPERFNEKDLDLVVGIEIDEPDWKDHPILGPKSRSFCQWTFLAKPHVPVMLKLVDHIMVWLNGVAEKQGKSLSDVELDFDEIISGTGPSAFTNAIIDEMNLSRPADQQVTWDEFHDMQETKKIGRFLVLTVEAFAAGQGHSNSGTHDARAALIRHHYHASNWPSRHHRYSHPVYGEVEICNWEDECVKKWDENVAAYNQLPDDEKMKLVEEKEREKQAKEEEEFKKWEEEERQRKEEEEENRRREEEKKEEEERRKKEEEEAASSRKKKEDEREAERRKEEQRKHQEPAKADDGVRVVGLVDKTDKADKKPAGPAVTTTTTTVKAGETPPPKAAAEEADE